MKVGDESEQEDQPGSSKDHECEEIYGILNVTENTDDESDNDENSWGKTMITVSQGLHRVFF